MKRKDDFIAKADLFQKVHLSNNLSKADQNSPHIIGTAGNEMWATGEWSQTIQGQNFGPVEVKGYSSSIAVREGNGWKIRMLTRNINPSAGRKRQRDTICDRRLERPIAPRFALPR